MRHATQSHVTIPGIPVMPQTFGRESMAVEAAKLQALRQEHKDLTSRLGEIKTEVERIFTHFNTMAPADSQTRGMRQKVEKPRPIEDKLSIAAGRAIVRVMKMKKGPEACRIEGLRAAIALARKYGLDKLPESTEAQINQKIKARFPQM